mmetsp:Transcript_1991/g.4597  ORF Transcript_1991/g.4597 Transcript_1991/m.4597 type:complete len:295 (-) Transcript_1991:3625-4509(-)
MRVERRQAPEEEGAGRGGHNRRSVYLHALTGNAAAGRAQECQGAIYPVSLVAQRGRAEDVHTGEAQQAAYGADVSGDGAHAGCALRPCRVGSGRGATRSPRHDRCRRRHTFGTRRAGAHHVARQRQRGGRRGVLSRLRQAVPRGRRNAPERRGAARRRCRGRQAAVASPRAWRGDVAASCRGRRPAPSSRGCRHRCCRCRSRRCRRGSRQRRGGCDPRGRRRRGQSLRGRQRRGGRTGGTRGARPSAARQYAQHSCHGCALLARAAHRCRACGEVPGPGTLRGRVRDRCCRRFL